MGDGNEREVYAILRAIRATPEPASGVRVGHLTYNETVAYDALVAALRAAREEVSRLEAHRDVLMEQGESIARERDEARDCRDPLDPCRACVACLKRDYEHAISRLEEAREARDAAVERAANEVPTNWLDPLLTGPKAVIGAPPYDCSAIERLLCAVKARIRALPTPPAREPGR